MNAQPPIITEIALVRYFSAIELPAGYLVLIVGHTVLSLPYMFLRVRSELVTYDQDLERASRILGADPVTTFRHVTGPIISPASLAGAFIAFVVSFGEFTATQFLISPRNEHRPSRHLHDAPHGTNPDDQRTLGRAYHRHARRRTEQPETFHFLTAAAFATFSAEKLAAT